jgi:peptidoglycan/xylan/chitin deacetylase (PgdA/CDA1 family)
MLSGRSSCGASLTTTKTVVPILVYHSVSDDPPGWIRPFSVAPGVFLRHLKLIAEAGATTLSVSGFADAIAAGATLPRRTVLITFDDGLADFRDAALPALRDHGLAATLYVTTGFLEDARGAARGARPEGRWLDSSTLPELRGQGIEIGGHSHTHPQLDTLRPAAARTEIESCKALLEDVLQERVRSFAYPHGYVSRGVRRLVVESGYESACAVKNTLSSSDDDPLALARLMVRRTTSLTQLAGWLDGRGAPVAPRREPARTRAWRAYRRGRALAGGTGRPSRE